MHVVQELAVMVKAVYMQDEAEDINPLSVVAVRDPQEGFSLNQEDVDRIRVIDRYLDRPLLASYTMLKNASMHAVSSWPSHLQVTGSPSHVPPALTVISSAVRSCSRPAM